MILVDSIIYTLLKIFKRTGMFFIPQSRGLIQLFLLKISNGVTAVLHYAIDMFHVCTNRKVWVADRMTIHSCDTMITPFSLFETDARNTLGISTITNSKQLQVQISICLCLANILGLAVCNKNMVSCVKIYLSVFTFPKYVKYFSKDKQSDETLTNNNGITLSPIIIV